MRNKRNKIKYSMVGMIIFSFLLLMPGVVSAKLTKLEMKTPNVSVGIEQSSSITLGVATEVAEGGIIDITFDKPNIITVDSVSGISAVLTTPTQINVSIGQNGDLIVRITGKIVDIVKVTFTDRQGQIPTVLANITVSTAPTGGAEVFLGDDCSSISENICTPAKNLICVACVNKTGIKCNDPEGNVCLGAVGYTGETGELAEELTPCDVGRDGSGVTEKVVNNIACDAGLICQNKQCINDYGGQALTGLGIGKASTDLRDQIRSFINIALGFLGVAGAIIVLYGGVLWMTARGNDEQVTKAKSTIVSGVIGIIIILLAWTIVSYVLKLGQQVTT